MTRLPFSSTTLRTVAALAIAAVGAACGSDKATGPKDGTVVRLNASDPQRDTLNNSNTAIDRAIDIRQTSVRTKRDTVIFVLKFMAPVAPSLAGSAASVYGYIDIDADQNGSTGDAATSDSFGGSSGIGVDYYVDFFDADYSEVAIYYIYPDAQSADLMGYAPVAFDADSIVVRVPRTMLDGDEGNFDFTVTVGVADGDAPSDIAPNTGRYRVGGSGIASVGTRSNRVAGAVHGSLGVADARALRALGNRHWGKRR